MTGAYATIAAGGVRHPLVTVTHITDRDGNEVARFAPEPETVPGRRRGDGTWST